MEEVCLLQRKTTILIQPPQNYKQTVKSSDAKWNQQATNPSTYAHTTILKPLIKKATTSQLKVSREHRALRTLLQQQQETSTYQVDRDWKNNRLKPNSPYPSIHHKYTDISDDNGFIQRVEEPTRGINTLDLIATNHPSSFRTEIIPEVSDDDIVYTEIDIVPTRQQQKPRQVPQYGKAKQENVISDINSIHTEILNMKRRGTSVNDLWEYFQTNLESSVKSNISPQNSKE